MLLEISPGLHSVLQCASGEIPCAPTDIFIINVPEGGVSHGANKVNFGRATMTNGLPEDGPAESDGERKDAQSIADTHVPSHSAPAEPQACDAESKKPKTTTQRSSVIALNLKPDSTPVKNRQEIKCDRMELDATT